MIDRHIVRELLRSQFPAWSSLDIVPVASGGTDNAIFRLGSELVVRLPKVDWATGQPERDQRWLPLLAPRLPIAIPEPLALGKPGSGYPWHWAVHRWIDGEAGTFASLAASARIAEELGGFVVALGRVDASGGPSSGPANHYRGAPLIQREPVVRAALGKLEAEPNIDAAADAWADALQAAPSPGPPTWLHGDLNLGNLIIADGRLAAVIDFGLMGVGDPACDLMAAWTCLDASGRLRFRAAVKASDADWRRGRGWAIGTALVALAAYRMSNAVVAAAARRTIAEVLSETA